MPRSILQLAVAGKGPVPATGASAVVLKLTVMAPTARGYLTAFPGGTKMPTASAVNFAPGHPTGNLAVVPIGAAGKIDFYNGSAGTVQLAADVDGYYVSGTPSTPGTFVATPSARLLDTRIPQGASPAGPRSTLQLPVAGKGPIPTSGVAAVVMNITAVKPTAGGYLTVFPGGTTLPTASALNFPAAQVVGNLVVVPVGDDGKVDFYNGASGTTQLTADVDGYFLAGDSSGAGTFVPTPPDRTLDTRTSFGASPAAPRSTMQLQVTGTGPVPSSGVAAVVMNVTAVKPTAAGYLTAFADDTARPTASALNFVAGQVVGNLVVVPVGDDGKVDLYNAANGTTQLTADIEGYYLDGTPVGDIAPAMPTSVATNPGLTQADLHGCSAPPYAYLPTVGGGYFRIAAQLSDPNGGIVTARVRLQDLGGTGEGPPIDIIGPDDPVGQSSPVPSGSYASVFMDGQILTNGHFYAFDVVADDGTLRSAPSPTCYFWYDATAPKPVKITSPDSTFAAGTPAEFDFESADATPAGGKASGIDYFAYSFSQEDLHTGGGTHVAAVRSGARNTATITTAPPVWGSNYLYVIAVDHAGNESATQVYSLYATG